MPFLKPEDPIPDHDPGDHHITIERRPDGLYDVKAHGALIDECVDPLAPSRGVLSSILLAGGLILAVVAGATKCSGALDTNRFLAAVRLVESSNPGTHDNGRAVGPYQMHRAAYLDVIRREPRLAHVQHYQLTNETLAKRFAEIYTCILSHHITAPGGRSNTPTPSLLYAAWNSGISRLRARGFSLTNCPRRVRENAQRVENLYRSLP